MEDYLFKSHVERCKYIPEKTTYLKLYAYTDSELNTVEEGPLGPGELEDFLERKGAFSEPLTRPRAPLVAELRLIVQQDACHPETFAPNIISVKSEEYISMIKQLYLPPRAIESTSCVGPLFWSTFNIIDGRPCLQIISRKTDVRKKGATRGCELVLSHEIDTGRTAGFCKGTATANIAECLKHLKGCVSEIGHPLLLPLILFTHSSSLEAESRQRRARDWLRRIEDAVEMNKENQDKYYERNGVLDFNVINRDLIKCRQVVLRQNPAAYIAILQRMEETLKSFNEKLLGARRSEKLDTLHADMLSRLEFYKKRLEGIELFAAKTLERLDTQKSNLYNLMAQKESRLSLQMAADQRKLARISKRETSSIKVLSLLGTLFLPGAFLASIFSTTFFNFQKDEDAIVSKKFWIYWIVTIPTTTFIVSLWLYWEKARARRYKKEDRELEEGVEASVMAAMASEKEEL